RLQWRLAVNPLLECSPMAPNCLLHSIPFRSEVMTNATDEQALGTRFSLTRMIYSVSAAIIFFKVLEYCTWFLIWKQRRLPWKLSTLDAWFHAVNLGFVLAMLPLILAYSKRNPFRWLSSRPSFGLLRSISSGLLGGLIAFI